MGIVDTGFVRASFVLAGPVPPPNPLPFFRYIRTTRDNAIAGFHADVFRQPVVETKHWKLHTFLVNDPAGIKRVLIDNADNYVKGRVEQRSARACPEKNFGASEEEEWRKRRRMMSASFDYRSIFENSPVIVETAQKTVTRWSGLANGTFVEAYAEMAGMTLEVISRMVFSSDSAEMAGNMELASKRYQEERLVDLLDFAPLLDRPWGLYKRYKHRRAFKDLDASIDCLIARRTENGIGPGEDFLGRLLAERDPQTGRRLSAAEVHGQIITILGTGHETAALALMWTWYLLSQHPMQEARLHTELDGVLGGRAPGFEDLARLPYTRMVIEEALRLYPPVYTMAWRGALEDDEVCGVRIPKGSTVSIVPWVLHRHSLLWDHPDQFDPERFAPGSGGGRSRFAYLPFGVGSRVCIGASFAITETILILATLAQRFRLRVAPGHKVEPQGLIALKARHGLRMVLENRYSPGP